MEYLSILIESIVDLVDKFIEIIVELIEYRTSNLLSFVIIAFDAINKISHEPEFCITINMTNNYFKLIIFHFFDYA